MTAPSPAAPSPPPASSPAPPPAADAGAGAYAPTNDIRPELRRLAAYTPILPHTVVAASLGIDP